MNLNQGSRASMVADRRSIDFREESEQHCRVRHAGPSDVQGWALLRQALWPAESPDELAAEARTFFVDGDTLLVAVLLAEASDGTLLGFAVRRGL